MNEFPFTTKVLATVFGIANANKLLNEANDSGQRFSLGDGLEIVPLDDEPNTAIIELTISGMRVLYLVESSTDTLLDIMGICLDTFDREVTPLIFLQNLGDFLSHGTCDPDGGFEVAHFDLTNDTLDKLIQVAMLMAEMNGLSYRDFPESFQEFVTLPRYPFLAYLMVALGEADHEPPYMFRELWKTGAPQTVVHSMKLEQASCPPGSIALSLRADGKEVLYIREDVDGHFEIFICNNLLTSRTMEGELTFLNDIARALQTPEGCYRFDTVPTAVLMAAAAHTVFYLQNHRAV